MASVLTCLKEIGSLFLNKILNGEYYTVIKTGNDKEIVDDQYEDNEYDYITPDHYK